MTAWLRRWPGTRASVVLAVLVAAGGTAASWAAGQAMTRSARRAVDEAMDRRAATVGQLVHEEVRRYTDAVGLLGTSIAAQTDLTRTDFMDATSPLLGMRLPGAVGVTFAGPPVTLAQVGQQEAYWTGQGVDGLRLQPIGSGQHVFGLMSRRLDGGAEAVPGFDYTNLPAPYTAMIEAQQRRSVAVTDTYTLMADRSTPVTRRQNGFSLVTACLTPDGRFKGWLLLGVRAQDFMRQVLAEAGRNLGTDVALYAQDANRRTVRLAALATPVGGARTQHRTVSAPMAQRVWTVELSAPVDALSAPSLTAGRLVQGTGTAISLLLGTLVLLLGTARARARTLVAGATRSLREAEADARRQSALLGSVLDSAGEGIGVVDGSGAFLLVNSTAEQLLGIDPRRDDLSRWREETGMFTPDGELPFPREQIPLVRALAGERVERVEILVRTAHRPEGLLLSVGARPLDERAGVSGAVCSFRDVTEERAREAELSAFAGIVAHDLRNPLGLIDSYAGMLGGILDELGDGPDAEHRVRLAADAEQYVDGVRDSTRQMSQLIKDLLTYTTTEHATLDPRRVDLTELAQEVAAFHADRLTAAAAADPGGAVRVPQLYVGELGVVEGDPVRLRQLFDNLIGNAIKYSPDERPARVDVTAARRPGGLLEVTVADRGVGIPDGKHGQVFQRFFRVPEHAGRPGTGLGLAICQRIVQLHGGTIAAQENPGGGTRIVFSLRRVPGPGPEDASPESLAGANSPSR